MYKLNNTASRGKKIYAYNNRKSKKKVYNYCSNCNNSGHTYKSCREPITSFGLICISIDSIDDSIKNDFYDYIENSSKLKFNNLGINCSQPNDMLNFCKFKDSVRFLMIRRKYTLGYIEFLRGRYDVENVDGIIFLFKQMVPNEIKNVATKSFDELWDELWVDSKKPYYMYEYNESKKKFESLKTFTENTLSIDFYTENVKPNWDHPEWGFPKGRRNYMEEDLECAIREFTEETGLSTPDFHIFDVQPFVEEFIGTNGLNYKHVYYLSFCSTNVEPTVNPKNSLQSSEIGDIGWFTYDEAINLIRPYHIERKRILTEIFMSALNIILKVRT